MQFRLRTLLIVLALAPPVLAGMWWVGGDADRIALFVFVASFLAAVLLPQLIVREFVKGAWPD